jgi:DNA repair exonuclease SbcCD nuclease subunit
MKILAIGDQHFKLDNISQVEIFLQKLKRHLSIKKYDIIVSGGDLLDTHERLHTQCLNKAVEYFKILSSSTKTFVLVGNHDMINPSQFLTDNHWLNAIKEWDKNMFDITIVDKPLIYSNENYKVALSPYVPDGMFCKALDTLENWKSCDLIFGHQTMNGVKMGSILSTNVEEWEDENPVMVSFHVHDMQKVKDNLFYTGSCMQHSFGESSKKYLMSIDISNEEDIEEDEILFLGVNKNDHNSKVIINKIDLGVPKRKIINCSTKELSEMKSVDDIIPKVFRNDMYILKIVVTGSLSEFKHAKTKDVVKKFFSKYKVIFKQEYIPMLNSEIQKEQFSNNICFKDLFDNIIKKEIDEETYKLYTSL